MSKEQVNPFIAIGKRLKEIRELSEDEPKHTAQKLGMEVFAYRHYERGSRKIPIDKAEIFAKKYSASVEYIYFGNKEAEISKKIYNGFTNAPDHVQKTILDMLGIK